MMNHPWKNPRIVHSVKVLLKAFYATVGISLSVFVIFHISSAFYTSYLIKEQLYSFNSGIIKEQTYLKEQGDMVTKNKDLIKALLNKDRENLIQIIQNERVFRGIGLMGVTDSQGVIIGRTMSPGVYGDNVFLTTPVGRMIFHGKSVQSIELTTFDKQIFMTTGRPIMDGESMVGGLFANYLLDDSYARTFKEKYLMSGSDLIFYTKKDGVYGNSFTNPDTRKLINSYFNSGSDWIKNGDTDKTILFDNGNSYIVLNVVFPGLEVSPGGALIFIPRRDISNLARQIISLIAFLIFLFLAYRYHIHSRGEDRSWRYYIILFGSAIIVFVIASLLVYTQGKGRLNLKRIPYALYNSTIRLQPSFGIYSVGFEQHVSVVVDTGEEKVNVVQFKLNFDPTAIEIKSINIGTSSCSYVVENIIDQKNGTATLTCGMLDTNQNQRSFYVADITIVPLRAGTAPISFDPLETKILAADGLGTNVLRMSENGSYRFDIFNTDIESFATSSSKNGRSFLVFSTTHPNENRWYNQSKAHFVWLGKKGMVYRYSFDTSPDTVPSNEHIIQSDNIDISIPGDGIYYFHLQLVSGGPIAHYKIRSDMTAPQILSINFSEANIVAGDVVRFSFDAKDLVSGLQKNYYIDLGNHLFLPIGDNLFVPFMEPGDQMVKFRVYDNAGNYSEKTETIHVYKAN
jgi:hypothetical protein